VLFINQAIASGLCFLLVRAVLGSWRGARAGPYWRPRAACTSIVSGEFDTM